MFNNNKLLDILFLSIILCPQALGSNGSLPVANKETNNETKLELISLKEVDTVLEAKNTLIKQIKESSLSGAYQNAEESLAVYKKTYGEDSGYLTEQARFLALTNQSQQALDLVIPLLAKSPADIQLKNIKKYALDHPAVEKGDYVKAETQYQNTLKKNPDDKVASLGLARVLLLQNQLAKGEAQLNFYKNQFGEDKDYFIEKARHYAFTNHSRQALKIVKPLLKSDPGNSTLLDIQKYALSHYEPIKQTNNVIVYTPAKAVNAQHLAELSENNADLYMEAAQAYLNVKDENNALLMVNKAQGLDPSNYNILKFKAELLSRMGEYISSYGLYKKLYKANPTNSDVLLALARVAGYAGKLCQSSLYYALYIKKVPDDKKAWLESAYIQSWRGNDRQAIRILNGFYSRFGGSIVYLIERARIVASANRPKQALPIINKLMPDHKNDFDLNYAATTAYYYNNQPIQMFQSLNDVIKLKPDSNETKGLSAFVRTPYRSNVSLEGYHSKDTDSVGISNATISGQYFLSPLKSILGSFTEEQLRADLGSGLTPINGGEAINLSMFNLGMAYRYNPFLGLQGLVGDAILGRNEHKLIYQGDAFVRVSDTIDIWLESKRNVYDVSALAVSLNVLQNKNQAVLSFKPCIQCYVIVNTSYSYFTDTNKMNFVSAVVGANLIATELYNFKLGVSGMRYGFSQQLHNGYYSPSNYRFRGIVADIYLKQSDNIGYEFSVGFGEQRDETFTSYKPANDYSAKAYYGIYSDWYLTLSAGFSTRGRAIANNPGLNDYNVYALNAKLIRRFN